MQHTHTIVSHPLDTYKPGSHPFEKSMNFNVKLYKRLDGQWGAKDPIKGIWNGMIGSLMNGDFDVAFERLPLYRASRARTSAPGS